MSYHRANHSRRTCKWNVRNWNSCVGFAVLVVSALCAASTQSLVAQDDPLDATFAKLFVYDWGPERDALAPIDVAILLSHGKPEARRYLEERFLDVLRADASRPAKSYVCRKLREMGTSHSVPVLAGYLSDEELGHMARGALESIPGAEATRALCEAIPNLTGTLKTGVIDSLGRRRDPSAVNALLPCLKDEDPRTAKATIEALASLYSPSAERAVLGLHAGGHADLQPVVTDACMKIARRHLQSGNLKDAERIFELFTSHAEEQVRCAVLGGLWRAAPSANCDRIVEALSSGDDRMRRFAAELVRQQVDPDVIEQLAEHWPQLPEVGRLCLLSAWSDRDNPSVRSLAIRALDSSVVELCRAALHNLAFSGRSQDVPLLLRYMRSEQPELRSAARQSLQELKGNTVDEAILKAVEVASPESQTELIPIIGARRIANSQSRLLALAKSRHATVRLAAIAALQDLAGAEAIDQLVDLLAATPPGKEREAAERAVWKCCLRIDDEPTRVEPILKRLEASDDVARAALLPALGRVGGERARDVIAKALRDENERVRDAAVRAVSNWPDAGVAEQLLELAGHADKLSHRIWALRGYARVIAKLGKEQPQRTYEGLSKALSLAERRGRQEADLDPSDRGSRSRCLSLEHVICRRCSTWQRCNRVIPGIGRSHEGITP